MKNCIVTGAGRGIGLEITKSLLHRGHKVVAISRNISTLNNFENENLRSLSLDITKDENYSLEQEINEFFENKVDVLINNAGLLIQNPIEKLSIHDIKKVYDVNVFGVFRMIQWVFPFLLEGAHVLNISSMGGIERTSKFPGLSAYSSSKGAVTILTEQLASEWLDNKISVNAIALGAVQTEMLEEAFPGYQASLLPDAVGAKIADFAINGNQFFNGKIVPMANTTP